MTQLVSEDLVVASSDPDLGYADGVGGGSARREYEKRMARREERVRAKHPRLGGLLLAIFDEAQSTRAWGIGAVGEEKLAGRLNKAAGPLLRVLHDRKIPGSRANIDHIVISPYGVWVVDAKRYVGKRPDLRFEGGLFRPKVARLTVGGRDRHTLVEGVQKQVQLVTDLLADDEVRVRGALCFIEADWPLILSYFTVDGVDVVSPRKLAEMLEWDGSLDEDTIGTIHARLAKALPQAI